MVMLDRQDYFNKAQDLLVDEDTYRLIMGVLLKTQKTHPNSQDYWGSRWNIYFTYKRLYPTGAVPPPPPNFMDSSKSTNMESPYAHCFQQGTVTFGVANELANTTSLLVVCSPHHINNTQHFVEHIKVIQLQDWLCMVF